jgi:hypothetical protein
LAGLIIAAWSLVAVLQPPADPVSQCRKDHPDADGIPVQTEEGRPHYVIEGCAQPGTPGVAGDGLWKADLRIFHIPGAALVERVTQAELFLTDCPVLGLDYHYSNQGVISNNLIVVQMGQVVLGRNGESTTISAEAGGLAGVEELYPSPDRLIVLNNGRNQLNTVSCEPLSALSAAGG